MKRTLLTTAEVAELTGTSIDTLRYWRHIGRGPTSFKLGRRVVYEAADVSSWLDERRKLSSAGGGDAA